MPRGLPSASETGDMFTNERSSTPWMFSWRVDSPESEPIVAVNSVASSSPVSDKVTVNGDSADVPMKMFSRMCEGGEEICVDDGTSRCAVFHDGRVPVSFVSGGYCHDGSCAVVEKPSSMEGSWSEPSLNPSTVPMLRFIAIGLSCFSAIPRR